MPWKVHVGKRVVEGHRYMGAVPFPTGTVIKLLLEDGRLSVVRYNEDQDNWSAVVYPTNRADTPLFDDPPSPAPRGNRTWAEETRNQLNQRQYKRLIISREELNTLLQEVASDDSRSLLPLLAPDHGDGLHLRAPDRSPRITGSNPHKGHTSK